MTKKYGIIGNPIKHSLSPVLHNYWFKKYKIDAEYSILEIKDNELVNIIEKINQNGNSIACIYLGGVNYYTGQALNMKDISSSGIINSS